MSQACKCDRCGNYFDFTPINKFGETKLVTKVIPVLKVGFVDNQGYKSKVDFSFEKEICPKCYEELMSFIKMENVENMQSEENRDIDCRKQMDLGTAEKEMNSYWCAVCKHYKDGECIKRLTSKEVSCLECMINYQIPNHFERRE